MQTDDLEAVTRNWSAVSTTVCVPHDKESYGRLVGFLDQITDKIGEDESHPLASLMEVLGILIERYEDEHVEVLETVVKPETGSRRS